MNRDFLGTERKVQKVSREYMIRKLMSSKNNYGKDWERAQKAFKHEVKY